MATAAWTYEVTAQARCWLEMETLQPQLAAAGGMLVEGASGGRDLWVSCGLDHGKGPPFHPDARAVVTVTPPWPPRHSVADITPAQFHEELAEASILAVLERLYDLGNTQRVLREQLPRPGHVAATMLKGKKIAVVADQRTAAQITHRLSGWGATLLHLDANHIGEGTGEVRSAWKSFFRDADLIVDATVGGRAATGDRDTIVPAFHPAPELRQALTEAVVQFCRSEQGPWPDRRQSIPTQVEQAHGSEHD